MITCCSVFDMWPKTLSSSSGVAQRCPQVGHPVTFLNFFIVNCSTAVFLKILSEVEEIDVFEMFM